MSTKAFKQDKVSLIKEKIDKAQVAIVTEYKGYSVEEITNLRRALQKEDGDYMVTKNTLAKLAVKDTPYEVLTETFKGESIQKLLNSITFKYIIEEIAKPLLFI